MKEMTRHLIALDIDGTLLNSQNEVTPETIEAIQEARKAGVRVVLATGRSAPEAVDYANQTGCDDRAVILGGAAIAEMDAGRHLRRWDIAPEAAAQVLETLRGLSLKSMVFAGEVNLLDTQSDAYFRAIYPDESFFDTTVVTPDIGAYLRENGLSLTKIHARGNPADLPPILELLKNIPNLTLTNCGPDNIEVLAAGVDKGRALRLLGETWNIRPEDMAAIGDSDNDLTMLRAVGWPTAMGNATEEVKAAGRMVTRSNDQNGVACAIRQLLKEWGCVSADL
jgi:hypothetical protein